MPRTPSEWTAQDWALVAHALLRTRWQNDLDDDHAFQLCVELAETEDVPLGDLLEALPEPTQDPLDVRG
ncbi:hypothetical protein GCM10028857_18770 [Salinarchaeum chitinilyticum]